MISFSLPFNYSLLKLLLVSPPHLNIKELFNFTLKFFLKSKSFLNLCTIVSIFDFFFFSHPQSLWYLSSLTRDWTQETAVKAQYSNQEGTAVLPKFWFLSICDFKPVFLNILFLTLLKELSDNLFATMVEKLTPPAPSLASQLYPPQKQNLWSGRSGLGPELFNICLFWDFGTLN